MNRFIKILERIQIAIGLLFLSLFFIVILYQIATRHLGISATWTVEMATNSFIWATFMGAAIMVNRREHFNFDILLKKLTGKKKITLTIFNDLILILFNIALFIYGIKVCQQFWNYNWTSIPELKMGYVWIAIPIMGGTMVIYSVSHIINHLKAWKGGQA
ncbi:TRAP transporter small permease [Ornithinibacillus sp. 179-J 7C1 HS]|uniref:TRAP transporter small permease n=1 Tax=Ornithinibacillus sp. 179-J 7C1 HS TaxID=3142384 RepID=UPI0039A2FDCE